MSRTTAGVLGLLVIVGGTCAGILRPYPPDQGITPSWWLLGTWLVLLGAIGLRTVDVPRGLAASMVAVGGLTLGLRFVGWTPWWAFIASGTCLHPHEAPEGIWWPVTSGTRLRPGDELIVSELGCSGMCRYLMRARVVDEPGKPEATDVLVCPDSPSPRPAWPGDDVPLAWRRGG